MSKNLIVKMRGVADRIHRNSASRKELKLEISRLRRSSAPVSEIFAVYQRLDSHGRMNSAVRLRNVCQVTGRARGYCRFFRLSRHEIVRRFNKGHLMGVVKSSW